MVIITILFSCILKRLKETIHVFPHDDYDQIMEDFNESIECIGGR